MQQLTPHQSKALNTKNSISLTANAGSGKTFVLAKRFTEIALNTDTRLSEIAAITFTDKAAGELYKRIAGELDEINQRRESVEIQQKAERLRKQLVSANISTIHSFCVDLLKQYPVEASLDADFVPIDQRMAEELIELSIEEVVKQNLRPDSEGSGVKLLLRLLGSKSALANELLNIVQAKKNLLLVKDKFYNQPDEKVTTYLDGITRTFLGEILNIELPVMLQNILSINNRVIESGKESTIAIDVRNLLGGINELNTTEKLRLLAKLKDLLLTGEGLIKSRGYLPGNWRIQLSKPVVLVERFFSEFKEIIDINEQGEITAELVKFSKALIDLAVTVISVYESKKKEKGYLDFEDILIYTRELIKNEDVRRTLNKKYKYILVDEYQDTNEIQYEILLPLVGYLQSGNLFIIGDEKQSIYRFRDAELEVFGRTRDDIRNADGNNLILTLPESFRMAPAICLFTNILFRNLFENPRKIFNEVEHSDLVCARADSFAGQVAILFTENEDPDSEAELLAKSILRLKQEQSTHIPDWSDIAVLVRKRSAFAEIENAFVKYSIPFSVVGGTGFYQKQCISDVYNYLSFMFAESDDAALIGTLRSPFFFVSDSEILRLSLFPGDTYWEKLSNAALTDNFLQKIYSTLSENLSLVKQVNIPVILRKILNESDFISVVSSRSNGLQEINNLNKLISITNNFFSQGADSFYDYLSFLKHSISLYTEEAQAPLSKDRNNVNVMTIHQAKGLEFPAVFIYKCNDRTQLNKVRAKSFRVDKNFGILTKVPMNENFFGQYYPAPVVELYNFIELRKEIAELKRLFYVGITRAKKFLFLSLNKTSGRQNKLYSFTDLLREGLNPDLNGDSFSLNGDLDFLVFEDNSFKQVSRNITMEVPVIKSSEAVVKPWSISTAGSSEKKISISIIKDHSEGELISATKYSVFSECPRKYYLTYDLGLKALIENNVLNNTVYVKTDNLFFNSREQEKIFYEETNGERFSRADIKGRIIHKILQSCKSADQIDNMLRELPDREFYSNYNASEDIDKIKSEILSELKKFYSSKEYQFLNSFEKFNNEFEVYVKERDFYLFGIIDKIIFDENRIIIADYKTEYIRGQEINAKAKSYLPQLFFYSYMIKRLYPPIKEIEIRIIFTHHPDLPFSKIFTTSDERNVQEQLWQMVSSVRSNYYSVNLSHCSKCIFAPDKNDCVLGQPG